MRGNLSQFDDNGIWTWYSDERTVVDTNGNKLVVGCVENANGLGGIPRDGNINVTIWDVPSGSGPRYTLRTNLLSYGGGDDHNAPGLLVMPNGHYLALYTGHNTDSNSGTASMIRSRRVGRLKRILIGAPNPAAPISPPPIPIPLT